MLKIFKQRQRHRGLHRTASPKPLKIYGQLWRQLLPRRKIQLIGLTGLMILSGIADMVTLGAVLPFLAVIVAPDRIFRYAAVARLAEMLGLTAGSQMVLPLTVIFVATALATAFIKILQVWCNQLVSQGIGHELSVEVYRRTLYQPYAVHLAYNTSEIISSVEKVNAVIDLFNRVLILVGSGVTATSIVLFLAVLEPVVAAMTLFGFGGLYGLLIWLTRRRLVDNSRIVSQQLTLKVKAIQEGLGNIRDVLLDNRQSFYCQLYRQADWPLRRAKAENIFISSSPRNGIESLGIVFIALLAYVLNQQAGERTLPILGVFALGSQRLLPALQQMYGMWTSVRGDQGSVHDVLRLLAQPIPPMLLSPLPAPVQLRSAIEFTSVSFRYGQQTPWVLQDVSFMIAKGTRVGFVGSTGSGKTTTLDLLMGLLEPTAGEIAIDGRLLQGEHCRAWQQAIAHVPQHIYLTDSTLAENIALGIPVAQIDRERLRRAAQQAQIAELIEGRPEGYSALIGERGIRLSGGQRQRVGIARALYKNASILIFDEATSALDNTTEHSVMEALDGLSKDLTIVVIAHRLTTVENCDLIIELEDGRVVAQGTYEELLHSSSSFRAMAQSIQSL
jgi:ATP-binding cassette, subfamily B, bacterial PglK